MFSSACSSNRSHLSQWVSKEMFQNCIPAEFQSHLFKYTELCPIITHALKCGISDLKTPTSQLRAWALERCTYSEKLRLIFFNEMSFPRVWIIACTPELFKLGHLQRGFWELSLARRYLRFQPKGEFLERRDSPPITAHALECTASDLRTAKRKFFT